MALDKGAKEIASLLYAAIRAAAEDKKLQSAYIIREADELLTDLKRETYVVIIRHLNPEI